MADTQIDMATLQMAKNVILRYTMLYGTLDEAIIVHKAMEEIEKLLKIALNDTETPF